MSPVFFVLSAWLLGSLAPLPTALPPRDITLWLLTSDPEGAIARGVRMGAEEMARTSRLLGRAFVLRETRTTDPGRATEALTTVMRRTRAESFVVVDLDDPQACAVAKSLAGATQVIVLRPRIQSQACSARMLSLRVPGPQRQAILAKAAVTGQSLRVDEWHPSLQRFGAQELNERYERRRQGAMDGNAWAGWFAAKAAAEAGLRLPHPTRRALTAPDAPAFDGHKGAPLRFNDDGVLEQPVYIIDGSPGSPGKVVKEVS